MIQADNLVKAFARPVRIDGRFSAVRTLFTRQRQRSVAVDGVRLAIAEGEIVGYLGPNGAGKSTTIKMLTGILVPTSGTATVAGIVPWENRSANARNIGVVFGQRSQLWWDLPLDESLRLIGKMYDVEPTRFRQNRDMLVELLQMESFLATPVRQLSLGQRMRGDLAAAMLYEPRVLYLDEPTVGLDVVAKERTRQFVEEVNRESGTTIMLTTHDLADVERLCKRIIFIAQGSVLYDGPVADLKRRYAPYRQLEITMVPDSGIDGGDPVQLDVPGAEIVEQDAARVVIRFDPELVAVPDLISAVIASHPVSDISIVEPDLEGVVREIVEHGGMPS